MPRNRNYSIYTQHAAHPSESRATVGPVVCICLRCAGHTHCVKHTMQFGIPLLVTGGGGYTKSNVARCWTNETAALVRQQISSKLPPSAYDEYFSIKDKDPSLRLNFKGDKTCEDLNRQDDINRIFSKVMNNLEAVRTRPTAQAKVCCVCCVSSMKMCCCCLCRLSHCH